VLSAAETAALRLFLDEQPPDHFFHESRYNRRGLVKELPPDYRFVIHWDSWFPVTFDAAGKITSERVTEVYRKYPGYDKIHAIFLKAMELMAEQLQWNDSTQLMGITLMQHVNLKKGQIAGPIEWHRDSGSHSLVILVDNEEAWEGGEFLFKIGEASPTTFIPKEGKGVLFNNEGTQHSVTPIIPKHNLTNRTILTFHRKP
jgi:hypothetical protein